MTEHPRPPRAAERLLEWALGAHPAARFVVGDLREDYAEIAARRPGWARWWYRVQATGLGARYLAARLSTPRPPRPRTPGIGELMRSEFTLAVRSLAKRPVVSAAIVLTIAGALAVTAIAFSLVNGVLLRPLPYATPDRLVTIWERSLTREAERNVVSPANYVAWREGLSSVELLTAVFETSVSLTSDGNPEQLGVVMTAGPFFDLLGVAPAAGRLYGAAEDVEGGPAVVVITDALWRRRFGSDPALIGRTVTINGTGREVIGVLPAGFDFAPGFSFGAVGGRDVYLPFQFGANAREAGGRFLQVIGRVTEGSSVAAASEEASTLAARLREMHPDRQAGWDVRVTTLQADVVGDVRTPIAIVFAAVCLVLLIACANVANLLMARAAERRGELAIRAALGAGRGALARQLFGESLVLALAGGAAGVVLSVWGVGALVRSAPDLPRLDEVGVDGGLLLFVLAATAAVACLIGIGPALEVSGRGPASWFAQRGSVSDRRATRGRLALVGVQVALSVVLVIGAGLLVQSLLNRLSVDLGIEPANVLTADINLPGRQYPTPEQRSAVVEAVVDRLSAMPEVAAAAAASIVPMTGKGQATSFSALDRPLPEAGQFPVADVRFVQHDYFRAMGISVLAGRSLEASDRPGAPTVVVINETGARQLWPDGNAVGQRIMMEWGDTLRAEIVGIVEDVHLTGPDQAVDRATLYWDYRQTGVPNSMALIVRGRTAEPTIAPVRAALAAVDPALPLYNVSSMAVLKARAVAQSRFITASMGLFSLLALGLAALGVYGVMSYGVQQRTREIGVRLALGADRRRVIRMLVTEGGKVVGPALAAGAIAALLLGGFLRSLVFGISPRDPVVLLAGLGVIGLVALGACWLPARRAAAIAPVEAIRSE